MDIFVTLVSALAIFESSCLDSQWSLGIENGPLKYTPTLHSIIQNNYKGDFFLPDTFINWYWWSRRENEISQKYSDIDRLSKSLNTSESNTSFSNENIKKFYLYFIH